MDRTIERAETRGDSLTLHSGIDADALARAFARDGHVQISPFLSDDSALRLHAHLAARADWRLVINAGERVYEIDRPGQAQMAADQADRLDAMVIDAARAGFQYRYESIRISDEGEIPATDDPLAAFARLMAADGTLDLLRRVTGRPGIAFADAQATSYGPGHFLTRHDDGVEGKQREAAYVLGLSPGWRTEWGGLLLLHDGADDVHRGYTPRMNVLTLFAVPQPHSVSWVMPAAGAPRYSITGWLRRRG